MSTNVFVKFLPQEVDDACLQELFAPFGRIESAKVMVDTQTWHTLGFGYIYIYITNQKKPLQKKALTKKREKNKKETKTKINRFVKYSRREEALLAIEKMAGYRIGNKTLMCKLSSSATSPASCNLYIKPLPSSFSEGTPLLPPLLSSSPSYLLLSLFSLAPHQTLPLTHYSPPSLASLPQITPLTSHLSLLPHSFSHIDTLSDMFIKYGAINTLKIVRDPKQPNDVIGLVKYPK